MRFQVLLHEGVVDPALRPRLERELRRIGAAASGTSAGDVAVEVNEISAGRFFTAGEPSRSSLIATSVPAGTSRADRTGLMSAITTLWCDVTGCRAAEVVVSVSDG
jgi:hypothetical protein